jgi:hypothetical protein
MVPPCKIRKPSGEEGEKGKSKIIRIEESERRKGWQATRRR